MNETLKVIANRYSCRDFKGDMPSDEMLKAIADAANHSPSARNIQPWRIIVVKDPNLIKEMEAEGFHQLSIMEDKTMYNSILDRGGKMFYNAPAMIVIPIDPTKSYSQIDCGILCQTITLAATSLGLGSVICGLTRLAFNDSNKSKEFGFKLGFPEGYVLGCSVLLGYANSRREPHEPDGDKIFFID